TLSIQTAGGQPVANPVLSVQFLGADGNPVSAEIALGPCGGGAFTVTAQATITATVTLDVDVAGCSNHPGPTITLTGAVALGGLRAKLIVRDAAGTGVGSTTTDMNIVALGGGQTISVPKQPVRGGVGGNPWIYAQLASDGKVVSDEILVGRCED